MKPYLYLVKRPHFRNAIARFRCSSHTLEIERGRHTNPKSPVADRVCVHCKVIEDEKQFLLKCDVNAFERQCFYEKISRVFDEFIYLNDDEKFSFVLTSVNSQYLSWLGEFLYRSFEKIKWICNMPATHRGRVTHIWATKLDHPSLAQIIGLSPVRRKAIIWTNADILWNRFYGTISIEILIESRAFSFKKHFKMSPAKWLSRHQCVRYAPPTPAKCSRTYWKCSVKIILNNDPQTCFCNIFQVMCCTCLIFYSTILYFNVLIWHLYFYPDACMWCNIYTLLYASTPILLWCWYLQFTSSLWCLLIFICSFRESYCT